MKRLMRILCAVLCLTLLPLPSLAEDSAPTIRVLLRRLNLTDRADLVLDGVYTVAIGRDTVMSFPKGSEVTVLIREGEMYLFYQGMSMKAGSKATFIRNASPAQQEEGLRFAKDGAFYPGDLSLTVEEGVLRPILTISVEDYLLGVVPYEMSNYFPLEALKAQAVCARTYALAHVNESRDYDVVDTTNDQVFKGVDLSYTNAVRAVEETAGQVGVYKGRLATCYYSASNGGQTLLPEQVWGDRGTYPYYAISDDPYDVENPESIVMTTRLKKQGDVSPLLRELLATLLADEMAAQGFGEGSECLRVDSITAMSLGDPQLTSRFMTTLTMTFTWSGRKPLAAPHATTQDTEISLFAAQTPAPTSTPEPTPVQSAEPTPEPEIVYSPFRQAEKPATVTIRLFPDGVRALDLSVYGADNEIVTLGETDTHFVLESRRYGHGVGMSQRGAQWMAFQYGKSYLDILNFYYPGMELKTIASGDPVLPTAQPALAESPAPPATPTPRPTLMPVTAQDLPEGAYLASVEGIADDSSLNLRERPTTASTILMRLYKHQQLVVLETCEDPAWVKVKTDVIEGYVMLSYLTPVE